MCICSSSSCPYHCCLQSLFTDNSNLLDGKNIKLSTKFTKVRRFRILIDQKLFGRKSLTVSRFCSTICLFNI